jgi:hypothetical protein
LDGQKGSQGKKREGDSSFVTSCNLSMKEGSLFCFVVMRSTEPWMLQIVFLVSLESSRRGGVLHGLCFKTTKVLEY